MPAKKKSRPPKEARGCQLRSDQLNLNADESVQIKWEKESVLPVDKAAADRRAEEAKMAAAHPWRLLNPLDRALAAVTGLADRLEAKGDATDDLYLRLIIRQAIRAMERSPHAREWMAHAEEWPSFVPGGPESGPLRKAWAKRFASLEVGKNNSDIPRKGKADYAAGKPTHFAKILFSSLDELRRSGPNPFLQQMAADGAKPEPASHTAARSLRPLAKDNVEQWRALALAFLEEQNSDWIFWLQLLLPTRWETAKTWAQAKANQGAKINEHERGPQRRNLQVDSGTAKSVLSAALLEGFRHLAGKD